MTTFYPTITICQEELFPYIRTRMVAHEPAPVYEMERLGIDKLSGVFELMQQDHYQGILGKAAYLFCSVIDGHHFSNGNKRLGVTLLIYFLIINHYKIHAPNLAVMRQELKRVFPDLKWEEDISFRYPHEYFFYHLALIIADRSQKGQMTFQQEQEAIQKLLTVIAIKEE